MRDENEMAAGLPPEDETAIRVLDESMRAALNGDYNARCVQAALDVLAVRRVSAVVPKVGHIVLPIADYLDALVTEARVSIDAVSRWARLKLDAAIDGNFPSAWGRLARTLGLTESMAWDHFRITFLRESGVDIGPELLSNYAEGGGETDLLAEYERSIKGAVDSLDVAARTRLAAFEEELRNGYRRVPSWERRK